MPDPFLEAWLSRRKELRADNRFNQQLDTQISQAALDRTLRERGLSEEIRRNQSLEDLSQKQFDSNTSYQNSNLDLARQNSRREAAQMFASGIADPGQNVASVPQAPGLPASTTPFSNPQAVDLGGGVMGTFNSPEEIISRQADTKLKVDAAAQKAEFENRRSIASDLFPNDPTKQQRFAIFGPQGIEAKDADQLLVRAYESNNPKALMSALDLVRAIKSADRSPGQEASSHAMANYYNTQTGLIKEKTATEALTKKGGEALSDSMAAMLKAVNNDTNDPKFHGLVLGDLQAKVKAGQLSQAEFSAARDELNREKTTRGSSNLMELMMMNMMSGQGKK